MKPSTKDEVAGKIKVQQWIEPLEENSDDITPLTLSRETDPLPRT